MGYVAISHASTLRGWMDNSYYIATSPNEEKLIILEPELYMDYYWKLEYRKYTKYSKNWSWSRFVRKCRAKMDKTKGF